MAVIIIINMYIAIGSRHFRTADLFWKYHLYQAWIKEQRNLIYFNTVRKPGPGQRPISLQG